MSYNAEDHFPEVDRVFAPALYPSATLRTIRENLGKNPAVVLAGLSPEDLGLHRWMFNDSKRKGQGGIDTAEAQVQTAFANEKRTIENALRRFNDLNELSELGQRQWCGYEVLERSIDTWCARQEAFVKSKRANAGNVGHHPEMFVYDQHGVEHYQAVGSDAGRPRRQDVALFVEGAVERSDFTRDLVVPELPSPDPVRRKDLADGSVDEATGMREGPDWRGCTVCSFQKQYDPDSRTAFNRAGNAVKMHARACKKEVDAHRAALVRMA